MGVLDFTDRLVGMGEAMRMLALSRSTVRRMIAAGRLKVIRPTGSRAIRFRYGDLQAFIAGSPAHGASASSAAIVGTTRPVKGATRIGQIVRPVARGKRAR